MRIKSKQISVSLLPLLDRQTAVCPADRCVEPVPLAYIALGHMLMSSSVFDCMSPVTREVYGPKNNASHLVRSPFLIELNWHFDICGENTMSPHGCGDYFGGLLYVMTSVTEHLPKPVRHADSSISPS